MKRKVQRAPITAQTQLLSPEFLLEQIRKIENEIKVFRIQIRVSKVCIKNPDDEYGNLMQFLIVTV